MRNRDFVKDKLEEWFVEALEKQRLYTKRATLSLNCLVRIMASLQGETELH